MKQFLLNSDGSIPDTVNVDALIQNNILLVIPTPAPKESGMVAVECEPQMIGGAWKQVWKLEPFVNDSIIVEEF
jgi:hypothetical protein